MGAAAAASAVTPFLQLINKHLYPSRRYRISLSLDRHDKLRNINQETFQRILIKHLKLGDVMAIN